MTGAEATAAAAQALDRAGLPDPMREARLLLAFALGVEPLRLTLNLDQALSPDQQAAFDAAVGQRRLGRPISQIIGSRNFWGRNFKVTPDVLDPRPETETLIAAALALPPPSRLADLGTGSGILAITLLCHWPDATALASDLSRPALQVAAGNARDHGVADRLQLSLSDWWESVPGRFDLVVSNPPYISAAEMQTLDPGVRNWEPHLALSPGGDGLEAYRRIAAGLAAHLAPSGQALFEIGASQAEQVRSILLQGGPFQASTITDMDGRDRVIRLNWR